MRFTVLASSSLLLISLPVLAEAPASPTTQYLPDDRGESYHLVNIRVQPLALIFGVYGADLSFRIARNWNLGGSFAWLEAISSGQILTARQYGINATFYVFGRTAHGGYFIRPGFYYIPISVEDRTGLTGTQDVANYSLGALIGRQWMWGTGFNVNFGLGAVYHWAPGTETVDLNGSTFQQSIGRVSEVQPLLEWSVGWAF